MPPPGLHPVSIRPPDQPPKCLEQFVDPVASAPAQWRPPLLGTKFCILEHNTNVSLLILLRLPPLHKHLFILQGFFVTNLYPSFVPQNVLK